MERVRWWSEPGFDFHGRAIVVGEVDGCVFEDAVVARLRGNTYPQGVFFYGCSVFIPEMAIRRWCR